MASNYLGHVSFARSLGDSVLRVFASIAVERWVEREVVITLEGEPAEARYMVIAAASPLRPVPCRSWLLNRSGKIGRRGGLTIFMASLTGSWSQPKAALRDISLMLKLGGSKLLDT